MAKPRPRKTLPEPALLQAEEAREFMVGHHGLSRPLGRGAAGVRAALAKLRCVQLDPLDPMGTNADLVMLARVDGIGRGDVHKHLYPGHAFEHFAKERCVLPATAFPYYRDQAAQTPWWRLSERIERLPAKLIDEVLEEVRERGPIAAEALADRGSVKPIDWSGWMGTAKAASMALEVLWTRCQVVVCGRGGGRRLYDIAERALPSVARLPAAADFGRWALVERVEAAGLLSRVASAMWSMLSAVRTSPLPDELVAEGILEEVQVAGSPRRYLAPAGFRERRYPKVDDRMRILGPLDSLLWDRGLVSLMFGFDYTWEVYKPAAQRKFGWYVCPLYHRGRLVGRLEGAVEKEKLAIRKVWRERDAALDEDALGEALARHAKACGVERVSMPRRITIAD